MLSRTEIFENAGFSYTCGRTKKEVFEYNDRELKQRRRRRQQERQKRNRVKLTKQQFCTCIILFCTHVFLSCRCTTTTWKSAWFHLLSRTGTQDNKFPFLFLNFETVLFLNFFQKKLPTFGELNKNKGDKVRGSANSLFKWRFRSRRSRWCLSSLSYDACSVRDDIVFTLYVRMRMFLKKEKKKSSAVFKNMDQCRSLGNCPPPPPLS